MKELLSNYVKMLPTHINDEGIYPYPGIIKSLDGGLSMMALVLQPTEAYLTMLKTANKEKAKEFIFGLDRFNKPGQDVDEKFNSVFTIISFDFGDNDFNFENIEEALTVGVLPYNSPIDIGEIQWDNKFWTWAVKQELKNFKLEKGLKITIHKNENQ